MRITIGIQKGRGPQRTPAIATTLGRGLNSTEYLYVRLPCPSVHTSYSRYSSHPFCSPNISSSKL